MRRLSDLLWSGEMSLEQESCSSGGESLGLQLLGVGVSPGSMQALLTPCLPGD